MSHCPPYDTKCDEIDGGKHVGSTAVRSIIETKKPDLVLCSHIHEAGGRFDEVGKTKILNLGRLYDGRAYVLEAEEKLEIKPVDEYINR